jgi:hypothetical protein
MNAKPVAQFPPEALSQYSAVVSATRGAELKGATTPYTSLNGNMYSFLDKTGTLAIRLGKPEREALIAAFGGGLYLHESGVVMKEYVALPAAVLRDTKQAAGYLAQSLTYAKTLKPKPTAKKKAA